MDLMLLQNNGASTLSIDDLGLVLEVGQQVNLIENFRDEDLLESQNLQTVMSSGGTVTLNGVGVSYQELTDYLTKLNRFDKIDFAYIVGKDGTTDITAAELEMLTNGSDVSSGASPLHNHDSVYYTIGQVDNLLTSYYTRTEVDGVIQSNLTSYYTGAEVDNLLTSYYTRLETDSAIATELLNYYTRTEVDGLITTSLSSYYDSTAVDALLTSYYTKNELQTPGSATVHWNNITNVPEFGSLNWKSPVDYPASSYGAGTYLPVVGNVLNDARMVRDDGDGKAAQYVCVAITGSWDDQWQKIADIDWGNASGIGIIPNGNLGSTDVQAAIYELQGDIDGIISGAANIELSLDDAYNQGSTIAVDSTNVDWNIFDGRYFNVNSNTKASSIFRVFASALVDIVNVHGRFEMDGGTFNLEGNGSSSISVVNGPLSLSTVGSGDISITSVGELSLKDQNLSTAIALSESGVSGLVGYTATSLVGALNEVREYATGKDSLDEAYDGPEGAGSGRIIAVDSGAVVFDATSNIYAPVELTQQPYAPSAGLAAGQLSFIDGSLYAYDATRAKWLSVAENMYHWSDKSASGKVLQIGNALDIGLGYRMPQNATIVKVTVWTSGGNVSKGIEVRVNGVSVKGFSLSAGTYTSTDDNISLSAGDVLQTYVSGAGAAIDDPIVTVYVKYVAPDNPIA